MLILLGATGYTGRLIAAELHRAGIAFQPAGRSPRRLEQLAAELPGLAPPLLVDARDPATFAALKDARVLINTVGPFTDLGGPVAAYAARRGLRYLDITNELGFAHEVHTRFADLARLSGATLAPACGFEVALADCLAALLAERLGADELDEVTITYRLPGKGSSYGTRASALRSLATSWLEYRDGRLLATRPCTRQARITLGAKDYHALSFPSSEVVTLPTHLNVRAVTTQMTITRVGSLYGSWFIPLMIPLLNGPVGWGLRIASRLAARPPAPGRRELMDFTLAVEARAGARARRLTLSGFDPYGLTAKIVAHAAPALADGAPPAGVIAPSLLIEPAALLEALRGWGVAVAEDEMSVA
ncbi:MAG TPA: hypothetical protein VGE07_00215 [Herpetosiphonaceae bacterium]